jgi:hypothetical protein
MRPLEKRPAYKRYLLAILALVVITLPALACETPAPTPTTTPLPALRNTVFTCPDTSYPLLTADGVTAGCVAVSNTWDYAQAPATNTLTATYTIADSFSMKRADVALGGDPTGIPQIPQFTRSFNPPTQSTSFPISLGASGDIASVYLNLHAIVQNRNTGSCSWVFSDGTETYKAYSNPKLGSDSSGTPLTRSGKAVLAWAPYADDYLYFGDSSSHFTFASAKWIWESYQVKDPLKGDIVDFTRSFTLDGTPVSGTLWITADDGYEVSLNGGFVGNHGLLSGWRAAASDLKLAYVPGHNIWRSVGKYDLMTTGKLQQGTNTLVIQTANRYMGPRNGDEADGTIWTNVGALKYEARICTSSPDKDARADGNSIEYIIQV